MLLRRLALLGGTAPAGGPEQLEAAARLGRLLAERGIAPLHDGTVEGVRGALLQAYGASGETAPTDFTDFLESADGFLALPGGKERLDQLLLTSLSGSSEDKPLGLLNTADYFTGLLREVDDAVVEKFVQETQRGRLIVERDPAELLRAMLEFRPPETRR